jgi:hypothetical protein
VYQRLAQTIGEDSRFFNPLCCPPQLRGPPRAVAKLLIR